MKKIGMITGSGPDAGIDLWKKILDENKRILKNKYKGDIDCPELYIFSLPNLGYSMQISKNEDFIWKNLKESLLKLDKLVDAFIIACNTLHFFQKRIRDLNLKSEFISIIDVMEDFVNKNHINKFAILGVQSVSDFGYYSPYKELATKYNIERLDIKIIDMLQELSIDIKINNPTKINQNMMIKILDEIESDICILCCTEFPLLEIQYLNKTLIDLNLILAQKVVERLYWHHDKSIVIPQLDIVGR